MDARVSEASKYETTTERASGRELVVTRVFDGPARHVFKAWTAPELLKRWWAPKSLGITLVSCEVDVRTGGTYRFEFGVPGSDQPVAFFGRYLEVVLDSKIVWTNDEGGEDGSVTTVTFEEKDGSTLLVISDVYPSEAALDAAIASGSVAGYDEQFGQLDALLATLGP